MKMNSSETNLFDDLTSYSNLEGEIIDVNDVFINVFKKDKEELIGKRESEVLNVKLDLSNINKLLQENGTVIYDEKIKLQNEVRYYKTKKELILDKDTKSKNIKTCRKDITFSKQYQIQYDEHKKLLKYIATGKSNEFILEEIIKSVEDRNSHMICSILLLDDTKERLFKAAAPSLPDFYIKKLDYMQIGEKVGSCGAAVYLKQRVVVSDISTHENWKYAKTLAAEANLHACWSQPFFSSENEVLGSFAIYYKQVKEPTDFDIHLIEEIASIVGIAVEKNQFSLKERKYKQQQKEQEELLFQKSEQSKKEILCSKNQLRVIIDSIPSMIFVKNKEGRFLSVNQCVSDSVGISIENLEGEFLTDIYSNETEVEEMLADDKKVIETNKILKVERENYLNFNKDITWSQVSKVPYLGDAFGEPVVIGIATDITKLKESEKEINNLNRTLEYKVAKRTFELEQSNNKLQSTIENIRQIQNKLVESEKMAGLGSLVAGVAHEINTPVGIGLTGITHFLQITEDIEKKYLSDNMSQNEFEYYLNTSKELAGLINRNLDRTAQLIKSFKQISVDQTSEIKREFELKAYIEDVIFSLQNIIKKTNLKIEINSIGSINIDSYPGAFSQIITNLILNSINHAYEGKAKGAILIDIFKENNNIHLLYKDDGKGISKENLKKIFDPFFTTNREGGGTGLGLNIIYNIITVNLKGSINCESEEGQGSVFTIVFPLIN